MLQSVLYFLLGFLCSGLLALMVAPAIWARAVALTKKRVESSVPLTLNEIQSDKDQLRAEFAMSTRRLEMSVEELREKAAVQVIEVNRKRDELAKLAEEVQEKIQTISELEAAGSELRISLQEREKALEQARQQIGFAEEELERRALEIEQTRAKLAQTQSESDSRRIELVAKETAIENLNSKVSSIVAADSENSDELKNLINENAQLKSDLRRAEVNLEKQTQIAQRMEKLAGESDERSSRRDKEISEIRDSSNNDTLSTANLTSELAMEKSRAVELEAKLAKTTLQMEAMMNDASNENVQKAMETLKGEHDDIRAELDTVTKERDELQKQLSAYKNDKESDWDSERRENAVLRERINDLAAQVTAMTASIEGPQSPINKIIEDAKSTKKQPASADGNGSQTLADRIRALQDTARSITK